MKKSLTCGVQHLQVYNVRVHTQEPVYTAYVVQQLAPGDGLGTSPYPHITVPQ